MESVFFGLPMMFRAALDHPSFAGRDLASLRRAVYAMAPMPDELIRPMGPGWSLPWQSSLSVQPGGDAGDSPTSQTDPSGDCSGGFLCGFVNDIVGGALVFGDLLKSWYDHSCGGPDASTFVVTLRGVAYKIPAGWTSRVVNNGKGIVFQRPGADGDADSIRAMEPTALYPNGYAVVYNDQGQAVDNLGSPGNPLGRAATHFPEDEIGDFPEIPIIWRL